MAKYEDGTYHKDFVCGGSNTYLKLITVEDMIDITLKIQSYVLHWYCTYLLHPGMDQTEAMIHQHLY